MLVHPGGAPWADPGHIGVIISLGWLIILPLEELVEVPREMSVCTSLLRLLPPSARQVDENKYKGSFCRM